MNYVCESSMYKLAKSVLPSIKKGNLQVADKEQTVLSLKCNAIPYQNWHDNCHHIFLLDMSSTRAGYLQQVQQQIMMFLGLLSETDFCTVLVLSAKDMCEPLCWHSRVDSKTKLQVLEKVMNLSVSEGMGLTKPLALTNILLDTVPVNEDRMVSVFTDSGCGYTVDVNEVAEAKVLVQKIAKKILAFNTICFDVESDYLKGLAQLSIAGTYICVHKKTDVAAIPIVYYYNSLKDLVNKPLYLDFSGEIGIYQDGTYQKTSQRKIAVSYDMLISGVTYVLDGASSIALNGGTLDSTDFDTLAPTEINSIKEVLYPIRAELTSSNIPTVDIQPIQIETTLETKFKATEGSTLPTDTLSVISLLDYLCTQSCYIDANTFNRYVSNQTVSDDSVTESKFIKKSCSLIQPFNKYAINSKGSNVNISFSYLGKVVLDKESSDSVGLTKILHGYEINCTSTKYYSIVKHGQTYISNLILHVPDATVKELYALSQKTNRPLVVASELSNAVDGYKCITLNMENLPILAVTDVAMDTNCIYESYFNLMSLKAKRKVLNHYMGQLQSKYKGAFEELTMAQIQVLEQHGLNHNLEYSNMGKSKHVNDNEGMSLKCSGYNALPKVSDVMLDLNKATNPMYCCMAAYIKELEALNPLPSIQILTEYQKRLKEIESEIQSIEIELNKILLSLYLSPQNNIQLSGAYGTLNIEKRRSA